MWIVNVALKRPYTFIVMAILILLATPFVLLTTPVDVLPVEAKKVDYIVTAPGMLDAFEHVQVTARVAGAVDRVAFSEGQAVKKGDTLVAIDSERYEVLVNSAQAALEKAQAAQADSEAMVARREAATSEHYESKASALNGIKSVQTNAPDAAIVDETTEE